MIQGAAFWVGVTTFDFFLDCHDYYQSRQRIGILKSFPINQPYNGYDPLCCLSNSIQLLNLSNIANLYEVFGLIIILLGQ